MHALGCLSLDPKKIKGNHMKDITFLAHDPLIEKLKYLASCPTYGETMRLWSGDVLKKMPEPIWWLSFLLLLVTGGGIIVYYDKEKTHDIDGRLLWLQCTFFVMQNVAYVSFLFHGHGFLSIGQWHNCHSSLEIEWWVPLSWMAMKYPEKKEHIE